jgi:hypothetical protein
MSSMRNWKHFHSPGDNLSTFTRSEPVAADEKATELKRTYPRGRQRKKVRMTAAEGAAALRGCR